VGLLCDVDLAGILPAVGQIDGAICTRNEVIKVLKTDNQRGLSPVYGLGNVASTVALAGIFWPSNAVL